MQLTWSGGKLYDSNVQSLPRFLNNLPAASLFSNHGSVKSTRSAGPKKTHHRQWQADEQQQFFLNFCQWARIFVLSPSSLTRRLVGEISTSGRPLSRTRRGLYPHRDIRASLRPCASRGPRLSEIRLCMTLSGAVWQLPTAQWDPDDEDFPPLTPGQKQHSPRPWRASLSHGGIRPEGESTEFMN